MTARTTAYFVALGAVAAITISCSSNGNESDAPSVEVAADQPTPTPKVQQVDGETRVQFYLRSADGTGQSGYATLTSAGPQTHVDIDVSPPSGTAQPIHIHAGTCDNIGTVIESLENVIRGRSATTVDRPLDELTTEGMLVNVHASFDDFATSTACSPLLYEG